MRVWEFRFYTLSISALCCVYSYGNDRCRPLLNIGVNTVTKFAWETLELNYYTAVSWETIFIAAAVGPLFAVTRHHDELIHEAFYDGTCHKNCNQVPRFFYHLANQAVAIPLVICGSFAFFATDPEYQMAGWRLIEGMFSLWAVKEIIKKSCALECCVRPFNELFPKKKVYNGFPSGHMAEITFLTTLFGARFGLAWGIPCALYAGYIFGISIACNRHFASQLLAGAGFGIAYGIAAIKLVDRDITKHISCSLAHDGIGPTVRLEYAW